MDTRQFRLIPHQVEAVWVTEQNIDEVVEWVEESGAAIAAIPWETTFFIVPTDKMPPVRVEIGDWVFHRAGAWNTCADSVFTAIYEEVS